MDQAVVERAQRWTNEPDGAVLWAEGEREDVREAVAAGVSEREIEIVAFRQVANRRYMRVRDADLPGLAASFAGVPFLRNHDAGDIDSRDGTVVASTLHMGADGVAEIRQRVRITTARGLRSLAEGQIDRFSVAFDVRRWTCSVCGGDWLGCEHMPGREYAGGRLAADGRGVVCELIAEGPVGREVSAVNVPAVSGTGVLGELCACKSAYQAEFGTSVPKGKKIVSEEVGEVQEVKNADPGVALAALQAEVAAVQALREELAIEQREVALRNSGLSDNGRNVVRLAVAAGGDLDEMIQAQQAAEAALRQSVRGNRAPELSSMVTPMERVQEAMDWCMGALGGPTPPPSLRNIRDVYLAVTGDVEFYGVFDPEHAQLAAASTSTLPNMARNSLNKVLRQHYDNLATFRWYERIVDVVPHDGSTHDIDLVLVDGLANLPVVGEGAAYTEAVSGDSLATMSFGKRGVYVGITLEMFRRSDIARMQAIPRELVKAAIRTRSAAIAGIFTAASGVGPTLSDDSTALFDATAHGNLATVAFSATEWAAARKRIFNQTVPGTGTKLALWPTFCLVPIDLYDTALTAFGYGTGDVGKPNSGGTAQEVNVYGMSRAGDPRPIPIVVPEWTDATDWAQIVDPRLHPVIHMAYASAPQGGAHALPEIYEVRSETAGLMFTNDTLPIKIRDWWAYGVATHVGVGKNNVTG